MEVPSWIEEGNFNPNYLMHRLDKLPQAGDKPEWHHNQDYWAERSEIPFIDPTTAEFCYA